MSKEMYCLRGSSDVGMAAFPDILTNFRYEKVIVWTIKNGIMFGYMDSRFGADNPVTREQMAVIFHRSLTVIQAFLRIDARADCG